MPDLALQVITTLLVSIVTAYATVAFALRRYRYEKWWERKIDAYHRVFESLHYIKRGLNDELRSLERTGEFSKNKEIAEKQRVAHSDFEKAVDLASFLLSNDAEDTLKRLVNDLEQAYKDSEGSAYDGMSGEVSAIEAALMKLTTAAKKDLRVT